MRRAALETYAVKAEGLHVEAVRLLDHGGAVQELRRHRSELGMLECLLDQLGWSAAGRASRVTVQAERVVLVESYRGALVAVVEVLAAEATTPEPDVSRVRRCLGLAHSFGAALEEVQRRGGRGPRRIRGWRPRITDG